MGWNKRATETKKKKTKKKRTTKSKWSLTASARSRSGLIRAVLRKLSSFLKRLSSPHKLIGRKLILRIPSLPKKAWKSDLSFVGRRDRSNETDIIKEMRIYELSSGLAGHRLWSTLKYERECGGKEEEEEGVGERRRDDWKGELVFFYYYRLANL